MQLAFNQIKGYIKLMLKNKIQGFSLVEVVVALMVASMGIMLINIGLQNIHYQLTSMTGSKVQIQWEKVISTLESEQMQFQWNDRQTSNVPILYCQTQKRDYLLKLNHHNLILQGSNGKGFMPLFMGIDNFRYHYDEPFLEIEVSKGNYHFHRKLVMQRKIDDEH